MQISELIDLLVAAKETQGDVKVSCGHHCVDRHEEPIGVSIVDGVVRIDVEENPTYVF